MFSVRMKCQDAVLGMAFQPHARHAEVGYTASTTILYDSKRMRIILQHS